MPRALKTNGIYKVTCTLTGEPVGTTPQVFADRAKRNGVSVDVLKQGYIGRTGAKLLATLVNEKGAKVPDAIKQIRASFDIKATTTIDQKIIDRVITKVTAKATKASQAAEFNKRKEAALAKLLGETPVAQKPAAIPETPAKDVPKN